MEINGHEETTGEEIDWEMDTDPHGQRQEEFCN